MIGRYLVLYCWPSRSLHAGATARRPLSTQPIQLAPGQSAVFETEQLEVTFVDVASDSRCASDVTCLWAGELVRAARDSQQRQRNSARGARSYRSVAVDGYTVTVLEVLPARGPEEHRIDACRLPRDAQSHAREIAIKRVCDRRRLLTLRAATS